MVLVRHCGPLTVILYADVLPVNEAEERIAPSNLSQFHLVYNFRAPSCLCTCQGIKGNYTESAMFVGDGPNLGKYMVGCASGCCGYLSESFFLGSD